jgi:dihydrodipicolinate synthase/N-acetylneuraminate lyase
MAEFRGALFGVVPILLTPFDETGELDEASLRNEVDFVLDAGAHGLGIALGSEVFTFTEAERDRVTAIVVDQARGRAPVVVNTGAVSTNLAVHYSQRAYELGASGLMCTPPAAGFSLAEVIGYFEAISDAVPLPIVMQDTAATPIPAASIRAIAEACEHATYAKVESVPPAIQVARAVREAGEVVEVFGGAGGGQLLQELRRGSIGTMPFPTSVAAFVEAWNRWRADDVDGAQAVFDAQIAPLLGIQVSGLGGYHQIHKEALRRQGVIQTAYVRPPVEALDPMTREDLESVFDRMGWTV